MTQPQLLPLSFWLTRDNPEELVLLRGKPPVVHDATTLTRIVVAFDDETTVLDSDNAPALFQWPVPMTYNGQTVQGIRLKLGLSSLTRGTYGDCRLIVYDATNWPNGLVWSEAFKVKVR